MPSGENKRRKLIHCSSDDDQDHTTTSKRAQKDFFVNASNWNLEQDYALRKRKDKKNKNKESSFLPQINTSKERPEHLPSRFADDDVVSVVSDTEWLEGREDEIEAEPDVEEKEAEIEIPEAQQVLQAQEELAKMALTINENPEENVGSLKAMAKIGQSRLSSIRMLTLLTQMAVYKDIIPGYRIRPHAETAPAQKEKVSKEVRRLQQFEQSLIHGYQAYVRQLADCAKSEIQRLSSTALTCACELIRAVPHFNFRSDLLKILVGKLSRRTTALDAADALKCREALEHMFREDEEGRPSFEAVSLLTKMMKARNFNIDEAVLNLFLSLRLLSEFSGKASQDAVDFPGNAGPKKKTKREFRTKRERKALKEQKALDKDMAQADALVSHEERDKMQSETLKLVFATYFRILKLRLPRLMGAVLEGLAKYARLINQDFFGDLLEALKDLIRHSDDDVDADAAQGDDADDQGNDPPSNRNLTREALLCTVTAFALLAGQDAHNARRDLHLDLSFFTLHLFQTVLSLSTDASLEDTTASPLSSSSSSSSSSTTSPTFKVNVQTTTVPPLRLAAFTKQLMTASLHLPDRSAQAVVALVADVVATHSTKVSALWNSDERRGDGLFNPHSDSVEGSNPFASTVWEGELLRLHFSPKVRDGIKRLEKSLPQR
ncbi:hypothetical protein L249_8007 [Ophiocordyceps polyrhachis-furcata BCC 54312]|uniref:Nucleolar complex-associated protein 3 n=1 Tax=Ophiocordyceps polyrhachis-furcata BCC 54312 TaxID=1330021 RepID=A0A367LHC0_9HYPO|nr:hypothetical protein L249_8007 [Ophiocordyceps polyrhachis-furcata BCC 54312]